MGAAAEVETAVPTERNEEHCNPKQNMPVSIFNMVYAVTSWLYLFLVSRYTIENGQIFRLNIDHGSLLYVAGVTLGHLILSTTLLWLNFCTVSKNVLWVLWIVVNLGVIHYIIVVCYSMKTGFVEYYISLVSETVMLGWYTFTVAVATMRPSFTHKVLPLVEADSVPAEDAAPDATNEAA